MSEFSTIVFDSRVSLGAPLLVEASAGTGKTYNIQNIYLRLVLSGLKVQEILVVTFTVAATGELRERLRTILHQCHEALLNAPGTALPPEQQRIQHAIDQANPTHDESIARGLKQQIQLALMDFDGAAFFTIHGFCKRVLERYAFECGHDPDAELMAEQSQIIRETCQDAWRRMAYAQEAQTLPFHSLDDLIQLVQAICQKPDAEVRGSAIPATAPFQELIAACKIVWTGIESFRGKLLWVGNGHLRQAQNPPVDVAPIVRVCVQQARDFAAWQNTLPATLEAWNPLAAAAQTILATARSIPATGDAKAFAKAVQLMALTADTHLKLAPRAALAKQIANEIQERIRDRSALTYQAMLANVRAVLTDSTAGHRLRELLREEFKAAMIDEFQDTDPVQYDIFWTLFSPGPHCAQSESPLVFVGDPKQAIYGFRGGDVFTYYQAKEGIPESNRHSLGTNFRSEANLVAAVNELFIDLPPSPPTFLNPNVPYGSPLNAHDVAPEKELLCQGIRDPLPLKVWKFAKGEEHQWAQAVARETVAILSDATQTIGGKPVRPGQIAVLVMKHDEAEAVQQALLALHVNAVRQAKGNVFAAADAPRLALWMQSMLDPGRSKAIRSALCSGLVSCSDLQIARFHAEDKSIAPPQPDSASTTPNADEPPSTLEDWIDVFREAGFRWHQRSFMEAFQFLSDRLGIRTHVAQDPEGARRLADIHHLVELIHQAAHTQRLGPLALLNWFLRKIEDATQGVSESEESTPRLADDDDAVQIMTIFKSKGLEFPIVFLPTLGMRKAKGKHRGCVAISYHEGNKLVLDLDVASSSAEAFAEKENREENIRLAYVGLTRAINRVYLFEMEKHSDASTNAVAHLLQRRPTPHILRMATALDPLPQSPWRGPENTPSPDSLAAEELKRPVDKLHGHASFSSLAPHSSSHKAELPARDLDGADANSSSSETDPPVSEPIFEIPGGAKLGECWHEIFETIDFQADSGSLLSIVNQTLDRYRICKAPQEDSPEEIKQSMQARRNAVFDMVNHVLDVPLRVNGSPSIFSLRDIPLSARRSELEFQFSLQRATSKTMGDLHAILRTHWKREKSAPFIETLQGCTTQIPLGFMTGFIDLVFQHNDRFHIVDWKSNQLTRTSSGFTDSGIEAEMARNSYYLQYLIYTVAIHGFLARRLRHYDYDTHFGGVFYLFLRGVDGTTSRGVYSDRPPKALIEALSECWGGPL